jgi:thymidylate synthase (FAD)
MPEQAREVLPNCVKTEIVITANLREWRHIFALRCSEAAHPQMRALMTGCLYEFQRRMPIVFDGCISANSR